MFCSCWSVRHEKVSCNLASYLVWLCILVYLTQDDQGLSWGCLIALKMCYLIPLNSHSIILRFYSSILLASSNLRVNFEVDADMVLKYEKNKVQELRSRVKEQEWANFGLCLVMPVTLQHYVRLYKQVSNLTIHERSTTSRCFELIQCVNLHQCCSIIVLLYIRSKGC